ncbi:MAG TPA: alpha-L-arabinofuranosidase C-terminal domain-containing protein [Acidobacteriaceae bacterium]|jgi:alpha-N-arabinofuranosidase
MSFPRTNLLIAIASLAVFSCGAQITVIKPIPAKATITVDAGKSAGAPIPRTIFGSFLEPIGNSTYNGLWAELLVNPSLEENLWSVKNLETLVHERPELAGSSTLGLPLPWEPLDAKQGNRYEPRWGNAANSWRSLVVMGVPGQPTGIKQEVYLPVQRTLTYKGSFFARHLSGPSTLTISLRKRDSSDPLVSATIDATDGEWKEYEFQLQVPQGALRRLEPADFVVELSGDERVDLDQFSLMPADAIDGLDPDEVAMAKAMETPLVRFGGNFTSAYHWRDGIGPRQKRVSMLNIAWGIPEYNTFGTDEFLHFCDLIGAEPQIALNLGSGTPQEAADWVRYVDEHWRRHSGLLWELGNELWGDWNTGWPTRDEIAGRTLAFSKAVRAVDPIAKLIATGGDPDWFSSWNALQLSNPAGTFDYLSTHFVVTNTQTKLAHPSIDFMTQAAFALPVELGRKLRADQQQINQQPDFANRAHVAFTEWLFIGNQDGVPGFRNMGGAVDTAGFFNMLMRNADIVPVSDMTGIMEFAGIWKSRGQVYGAPGYYAFRMYSTAHPALPVQVVSDSGSYSVKNGVRRLPEIEDVPYLDVTAALDSSKKTLSIFCVNRSLHIDIPADIAIRDFATGTETQVQTLRSASINDENDDDRPERVVPVTNQEDISREHLEHIFPHESVTVITLRAASAK